MPSSKLNIVMMVLLVNVYIEDASASGPLCGSRNLTCIDEQATCVNGACVCDGSTWGDGHFACYQKNEVAAEVRGDPQLINFNNEKHDFPFPCRYLMTHVRQELKDNTRTVIGKCEFKIHAFHKRARGKMYVYGVDIAARINYDNGTVVGRSVRKYGNASSDDANFTVMGVKDYRPDGPWTPSEDIGYHDVSNNIRVQCYEDRPNNRLVFQIKKCGVEVTFTPYDIVDRRKQVRIPGLSIAIDCAHHPVWLSHDQVMGLAPVSEGGQSAKDLQLPGLPISHSLAFRALTRDVIQNQPEAGVCPMMKPLAESCSPEESKGSRRGCRWMLLEPRFIRCISDSGFDYLDIFRRCVSAWCLQTNCTSLVRDVRTCMHVKGIPLLDTFVTGTLCPPT